MWLRSATNLSTTSPSSSPADYIIERRQAISMERLNNIPSATRYLSQINQGKSGNGASNCSSGSSNNNNNNISGSGTNFLLGPTGGSVASGLGGKGSKDQSNLLSNNNGSLSSGSNSSIDESASDAEQQQNQQHIITLTRNGRSGGLSRSASRVSRFRSAKEFFERLSSVNGSPQQLQQQQQQQQQQHSPSHLLNHSSNSLASGHALVKTCRQSPERPRGNVAQRYIAPLVNGSAVPPQTPTSLGPHPTRTAHGASPLQVITNNNNNNHLTPVRVKSQTTLGKPPPPSQQQQQQAESATTPTSPHVSIFTKQLSTPPAQRLSETQDNRPDTTTSTTCATTTTTASEHQPKGATSVQIAIATTTKTAQDDDEDVEADNDHDNGEQNGFDKHENMNREDDDQEHNQRPSVILNQLKAAAQQTSQQSKSSSNQLAPAPATATPSVSPLRPRSLPIQTFTSSPLSSICSSTSSSSLSSSTSAYVKLKTTDHSSLSTNTILHINNSHLSQANQRGSDSNGFKTVMNNGCCNEPALPFEGDNVIIGSGSLLVRRNKQLRIKFDETRTATFEYPSESSAASSSSSMDDDIEYETPSNESETNSPTGKQQAFDSDPRVSVQVC
ncbi:Hypothetical predicted protein [Olea europaea subsp. europaea]|uniref:Uncharacterized protein n=1 Tax=Olea europaea subsp. europaea TaxID=158383 RepID=A0A8S0TH55_OLEEU|nr:Hypothetical predicted protein [Olea europaea subsp. europaea]